MAARIFVAVAVVSLLGASGSVAALGDPARPDEPPKVIRYLAWKDSSGRTFGEAVETRWSDALVQRYDVLLRTPAQHRATLSDRFVPSRDLALGRFTDETSGWAAELELRSGLDDLGALEEWDHRRVGEMMRRSRQEGVVPVYVLETPEIRLTAEDVRDEAGQGGVEALAAELAASGVLEDLPDSAREAIRFSRSAMAHLTDGGVAPSLVRLLTEALRAADDDRDPYEGVEWEVGAGRPERYRADSGSPAQVLLDELGGVRPVERIEALREEGAGDDRQRR